MSIDFDTVETDLSNELLYILEEFECESVLEDKFQLQRLAERGEYIRIWPGETDLISLNSDGETRQYPYQITHYFDRKRYRQKKDWDELYSGRTARMRQLMRDNHYKRIDNDYIWHDLSLVSFTPPTDDLDDVETDNVYGIVYEIEITRSNF